MVDKFADAGILASMLAVMLGLIELLKAQIRKRLNGSGKLQDPEVRSAILAEIATQLRWGHEIQERMIAKLDLVVERQAVDTERLCALQRDLTEIKRKGAV